MDKTTTPESGDKHDYISLARYYWPTAGAANGCPYTRRDGETNPETSTSKYDHASRHAAMDALFDLALAWYFTGDERYARRAALVARTWFLNPATKMNPNVNFGEGVPCLRPAADTGVLNWTEVIGEALDAVAVLELGAPGWTAADQTGMRAWMTDLLKWLQTNKLGTSEGAAVNNHGTWYNIGLRRDPRLSGPGRRRQGPGHGGADQADRPADQGRRQPARGAGPHQQLGLQQLEPRGALPARRDGQARGRRSGPTRPPAAARWSRRPTT